MPPRRQPAARARRGLLGLAAGLALLTAGLPAASASISISGTRILLDGEPFFIKGAAGSTRLHELKDLGANTVRTYGDDPGPVLDEAARVGLRVIAGLWLEPPRRGFDYADRAAVTAQLDRLRATVERYRAHPALLMWGIGNEVEAELTDPSPVWPAIEEAARMVKSIDSGHPTMAVLMETGTDKIRRLREAAPSIDVIGLNSYGDALPTLAVRARRQRWEGPFVVAEFGPLGQWQAGRTAWGAAIEPTSTDKAARMRGYMKDTSQRGVAGQIVFYWGQKQEVTPSWHGLFLPGGDWTETLEVMAAAWGGRTPGGNRAPRIASLRFAAETPDSARSRAVVLDASDPDGDPLAVHWQVLEESTDLGKAGDAEPVPPDRSAVLRAGNQRGVRLEGLTPGNYRIFAYVRDGRGAAATGNLPFRVE